MKIETVGKFIPPKVPTFLAVEYDGRCVAGEERRLRGVEDDRLDVLGVRRAVEVVVHGVVDRDELDVGVGRRPPRAAADASAKPTVMMSVQFWSTRLVMFGAKSASESDWTVTYSTPSSSDAASRPSNPSWLNDLSSNPPASETMQGLKPSTAPPAAPVSVGVGFGCRPAAGKGNEQSGGGNYPDELLGGRDCQLTPP